MGEDVENGLPCFVQRLILQTQPDYTGECAGVLTVSGLVVRILSYL